MIRTVRALALCVSLGACASGPGARDDARHVVAVVLLGDLPQRDGLLAARPFHTVDLTDAWLLLTSDNLVGMLDLAAPDHWPAAAQEAWTSGAAACRARGVRPPWSESKEARRCADELGPAVLHRLARAHGAGLLVVARAQPDNPGPMPWVLLASTPGANDAREVRAPRAELGAALDALWRGEGMRAFTNTPSLPQPARAEDDVATQGYFTPFDVIAVGGCIRPMPVSLEVAPADVPMTNMIEHAWSRMSATVRTAPATTCQLRAVRAAGNEGERLEAALDCAGMPLARRERPRGRGALDDDLANLAKELVDALAFDTCKMHPHPP